VKRRFCRRWKYGYLFALLLVVLAGCGGGDWSSGDRVLVSKFLYDSGLDRPRRYDVVVFRYPKRPLENGTPKNYIKRLLGLPGELLAIFFGNIFRYNEEKHGPVRYDDNHVDPNELWRRKDDLDTRDNQYGMHEDKKRDRDLFEAGKFEILRKPPATLLAMRRIVYDNDYPAKDLADNPRYQRWPVKDTTWEASGKHGFKHGGQGQDVQWLRYHHIPRTSQDPKKQLITDFLGYNAFVANPPDIAPQNWSPPEPYNPGRHNWVGDLILECEVTVEKAEGEFCMELSRGKDRFQACWNLATGECTLYRLDYRQDKNVKRSKMATEKTSVKAPGTYELRFANVDERLTVWVGRELPFKEGVTYPTPLEDQGPYDNDLEPASLGSKGAAVKVQHLRLWRDVYYLVNLGFRDRPTTDAGDPAGVDYSDSNTWKPLRNLPKRTIYVQPRHYFCLGDNSAQSSDSREWGLVPERLMLGRALMVYFPFGRAGAIE
jgi:signal peptidase I